MNQKKGISLIVSVFVLIFLISFILFSFWPSSLPEVGKNEFLFTDGEGNRYAKFKHSVENDSYELCLELVEFGEYVEKVEIDRIISYSRNFNGKDELMDTIEKTITDIQLSFEKEGDHERLQLQPLWNDKAERVEFEIEFNGKLIGSSVPLIEIPIEKPGSGEINFSISKKSKSTWLPLNIILLTMITIGIYRKKNRKKYK